MPNAKVHLQPNQIKRAQRAYHSSADWCNRCWAAERSIRAGTQATLPYLTDPISHNALDAIHLDLRKNTGMHDDIA